MHVYVFAHVCALAHVCFYVHRCVHICTYKCMFHVNLNVSVLTFEGGSRSELDSRRLGTVSFLAHGITLSGLLLLGTPRVSSTGITLFPPVFRITDFFFLLFKNFPCGFIKVLRDQGDKHTCLFLSSWDPHKLVL